ncbi:helix-turn-helix domain-containing protein [Blautia faecis]|mgnify:FL=1|uniref:helix-turn-helix domain-containing protein n=1 Tax=Blautia faecis TaxID=871665 RepID=UPI0016558BB1|nr:helix-turn-helix domain-containing protein [Blautia faecis]MBC8612304.1 helix-turn-helix domain-containing protein [Blautia faecis]
MGFRELLNRAKTMDDTAMVQIIELYNPLLFKYANVNCQFDQDLYEEFVYRLIICVVKFPY